MVLVYTDGGCKPNPGKGGWGAVIIEDDGSIRELSGRSRVERTMNNRMEMGAIIMALRDLQPTRDRVVVRSDSELLVKTLNKKYRRKANIDLWRLIDREVARFATISFEWVRGHAGDQYNEMADRLANRAIGSSERAADRPKGKKFSLNCNKCRRPMQLLKPSHTNNGAPSPRFRCDSCRMSAYKDIMGAHYFPDFR